MPDAGNIENSGRFECRGGGPLAGLDHVVLRVGNLDARDRILRESSELPCRTPARAPKLVQLRAGASLIDLVLASASPGEAGDGAGGAQHGSFRRTDRRVRSSGLGRPSAAAWRRGRRGVRERYGAEGYGPSLYICDPDGNTVELKGPATRGL